jgi:hypothetical protein
MSNDLRLFYKENKVTCVSVMERVTFFCEIILEILIIKNLLSLIDIMILQIK